MRNMKQVVRKVDLIFAFALAIVTTACKGPLEGRLSPDGRTSVEISVSTDGTPSYSVLKNGRTVINPSVLGFVLEGHDLTQGFTLLSTDTASHDETWETVWGEEQYIRNHYNEITAHFCHKDGILMDVIFRVFDDGFAFRYAFPEQELKEFVVLDEATSFVFAKQPEAWSIPWRTEYYEALWQKAPISLTDTACSPVTLEMGDGHYGFLHEAALTNYPAENFYFCGDTARIFLTPWRENDADIPAKAYLSTPFVSPWRFLILADNLPEMVASRIMLNLNEPCQIEDTEWIKPMKFIGIWWGMHMRTMTWSQGPIHGATTANMERYLQFAADHHIGGVLAEGWNLGWEGYEGIRPGERFSFVTPYSDYDINYLADFAHRNNVEIVFHHETSGNADQYQNELDTAYAYMEHYGMHSVKTGYVAPIITTLDGHQWNKGQSGVRHYRTVIETAAKHHICIDNHEPVMPTGLQRTWPNLFTQEGVRGQEWNAWAQDGGSPCEHVTVLPYTRIMAGPVDYTPGVFNFANPIIPGTRVHSTLMNQLGLFVCFYSPLQMACDLPENYEKFPDAFRFIEDVPCDWQKSILLDGAIGDYVIFARQDRNSNNWFIGGITDENARTANMQLSFLDTDKTYEATIYRDAEDAEWENNPYAYVIEKREVRSGDLLKIDMAKGGGFAISIVEK